MKYKTLPSQEIIDRTIKNLAERNIHATLVANSTEALEKIKNIIPAGASIMNGTSRTLEEIGFIDILKTRQHPWKNLHDAILEEQDSEKRESLRRQSVFSDYFLVSTHAITEEGELVNATASGSQIPAIVFTAQNVIFVAGAHKIVPTLEDAILRIRDYVFPLEDARMKSIGAPGSVIAKMLIFEREASFSNRKIHLILINESHGF